MAEHLPTDPARRAHIRGFTLFETLVALAVISILAVVAVPSYLNFQVRVEITEGITASQPLRLMLTEYFQTYGKWPRSNQEAGLLSPEKYRGSYIDRMEINGSDDKVTLTVVYNIRTLGDRNTLVFSPVMTRSRTVRWTCNKGSLPEKYRPANCRND